MSRLCGFVQEAGQVRTDSGEVYEIYNAKPWLKNGVIVEFSLDEWGRAIDLKAFGASKRYKVPDSFMLSSSAKVRGWQSINQSKYELIGESNFSKTAATTNLRKHATAMGANAVVGYKIERFFLRWRARGIPAQIGQPSELFEDGLVDERDFSELYGLSEYIKKKLTLRKVFAFLSAMFALAFGVICAMFFDDFVGLDISNTAFCGFILAGIIWALAIKPTGAYLKEVVNE